MKNFDVFTNKMVDYLKKALIYGHTRRIYYQFTTFEGKNLDIYRPEPCKPKHQHTVFRKNK